MPLEIVITAKRLAVRASAHRTHQRRDMHVLQVRLQDPARLEDRFRLAGSRPGTPARLLLLPTTQDIYRMLAKVRFEITECEERLGSAVVVCAC